MSMFFVFTIGIPIKIIIWEDPNANYFVNLAIIVVTCMSIIAFIFWPKYKFQKDMDNGKINMQTVVKEFTYQSVTHSSSNQRSSFDGVISNFKKKLRESLDRQKMPQNEADHSTDNDDVLEIAVSLRCLDN